MNKPIDPLDDLPDMPADPIPELRTVVPAEDLHLGVPEVRAINKDWWIKEYGPKPPGPGIFMLDALIVAMALGMLNILFLAWTHVFS
jgi:hypothetical protein